MGWERLRDYHVDLSLWTEDRGQSEHTAQMCVAAVTLDRTMRYRYARNYPVRGSGIEGGKAYFVFRLIEVSLMHTTHSAILNTYTWLHHHGVLVLHIHATVRYHN